LHCAVEQPDQLPPELHHLEQRGLGNATHLVVERGGRLEEAQQLLQARLGQRLVGTLAFALGADEGSEAEQRPRIRRTASAACATAESASVAAATMPQKPHKSAKKPRRRAPPRAVYSSCNSATDVSSVGASGARRAE
jgi:hypothetical protein